MTLSQQIFEILSADGGVLTVDTLRRKLRTTKAAVIEALGNGLSHIVEFDHEAQTVSLREDLDEETVEETLGSANPYDFEPLNEPGEDEDEDENFGEDPTSILDAAPTVRSPFFEDEGNANEPDDEDDDEDDDNSEPTFRFPAHKRQEYAQKGGNCGDELAAALTEALNVPSPDGKGTFIDEARVLAVAEENGLATVRGANAGQFRMNLSNMLRAKLRRGEDVTVMGRVIRGEPNPVLDRMKVLREIAQGYESQGMNKKEARIAAEQELEAKIAGGVFEVVNKGKLRRVPQ